MEKDLIETIAEEIAQFQLDIPYENYEAHGEPHSYKPSITVEQVTEIIEKHVKVEL